MVLLWLSYGVPMIFSHGFPMAFLWLPYGFPMVFLWLYHGFPMAFPWLSYGFPMVALWLSYGTETIWIRTRGVGLGKEKTVLNT